MRYHRLILSVRDKYRMLYSSAGWNEVVSCCCIELYMEWNFVRYIVLFVEERETESFESWFHGNRLRRRKRLVIVGYAPYIFDINRSDNKVGLMGPTLFK
jgi:hypothetical protein